MTSPSPSLILLRDSGFAPPNTPTGCRRLTSWLILGPRWSSETIDPLQC